ncbi:unnamed protein product [Urochloa humidicola]
MEQGRPAAAAAEGNDEASRRWRHYARRDALRGFCVGVGLAMSIFVLTIKLPCETNTGAAVLVGIVLLMALVVSAFGFLVTGEWHKIPY